MGLIVRVRVQGEKQRERAIEDNISKGGGMTTYIYKGLTSYRPPE